MHIIANGHLLHWLVRQVAIPSSFPSYKLNRSGQIFTIGSNDFFIPVETVLTVTITGAVTFTVQVHIHKTIAFFHLACGSRNQINAAPRRPEMDGFAQTSHGNPKYPQKSFLFSIVLCQQIFYFISDFFRKCGIHTTDFIRHPFIIAYSNPIFS